MQFNVAMKNHVSEDLDQIYKHLIRLWVIFKQIFDMVNQSFFVEKKNVQLLIMLVKLEIIVLFYKAIRFLASNFLLLKIKKFKA